MATQDVNGGYMIEAYMDAVKSSSGSAMIHNLFQDVGDPTLYYTGALHGRCAYHPTGEHIAARRMEPSFYAFLQAYTTEI
jgi:hypothetical protein